MKYNQNKGRNPEMGDLVEIMHTNSDMDGMTGEVAGKSSEYILIVILHEEYFGSKAVTVPVVCLDIFVPADKRSLDNIERDILSIIDTAADTYMGYSDEMDRLRAQIEEKFESY